MDSLPTILQIEQIQREVSNLVTQNPDNTEGIRAWFEDRLLEADDAVFDLMHSKKHSEELVEQAIQGFIGFWLEYGSFEVSNKQLAQVFCFLLFAFSFF